MSKIPAPIFSLLLLALLTTPAAAQIASPGRPASVVSPLPGEVPVALLPAPDVATLKAEDAAREGELRPWRYGAVIETAFSPEAHGRWDETDAGELVWRLELASPGAHSLGVLFDEFDLPPGAQLFLYDPLQQRVLGAYTEANEKENGMLPVQPLAGDRVVVEYVQPASSPGVPRLSIGQVVHDYRNVIASLAGDGGTAAAMACFVDINCSEGDPYQDIERSVIMLLSSGGQCSGAILNNTAEDGKPFMLTADHCGSMANAVFVFGYELTGCGTGTSSTSQTLSSSTRLARAGGWDSQLCRLSQTPPASYEPFYAGWGRGGTPKAPIVSINHPQGLPKKIAIDDDNAVTSGNFWRVQWEGGLIHNGSSGSPLFNGNGRVVGQACCADNFTCGSQAAFYSQFKGFWNSRNISQWLDPLGTGATGIDGYDPVHPQAFTYNGGKLNPNVFSSTTLPGIGTTWTAEVDASGHPGATSTLIVGRVGASSGTVLAWGELLIDPTSAFLFQSLAPVAGGLSPHSNAIPDEPALANAVAYTQAAILGGGVQLTNGIKLRLNQP